MAHSPAAAAVTDAELELREESPLGADLAEIFARHRADMHAQTPPESIYMMGAEELACADVRFFTLRLAGKPMAMAALKRLDERNLELKSMHVMLEARGMGLSMRLLGDLFAIAREMGAESLSLETGREPIFAPATALYKKAGFVECPPFGSYTGDPNSLYMTRKL